MTRGPRQQLRTRAVLFRTSKQRTVVAPPPAPVPQVILQDTSILFVTAYIGRNDYSALLHNSGCVPRVPSTKYRALAFTSRETEAACGFGTVASQQGWEVVYMDEVKAEYNTDEDNFNLSAKQPKICPHKFPAIMNSGAKFMVWCDNKYIPNVQSAEKTIRSWPNGGAVCFSKHPLRRMNGARTELEVSMEQERYARHEARMEAYIADQVSAGLKAEHRPHFTATCIYWNLRSHVAVQFQHEWWTHIEQCGIQDQVSLCFVAQKFESAIYPFPGKFEVGDGNLFEHAYKDIGWAHLDDHLPEW